MAPYYPSSYAPEKIREYRQGALVWNMWTWVKRFKVEKILKKGLKFCNIHRKIPVLESLFNKVTGLYYEIFMSTYFEEHLWTAAFKS